MEMGSKLHLRKNILILRQIQSGRNYLHLKYCQLIATEPKSYPRLLHNLLESKRSRMHPSTLAAHKTGQLDRKRSNRPREKGIFSFIVNPSWGRCPSWLSNDSKGNHWYGNSKSLAYLWLSLSPIEKHKIFDSLASTKTFLLADINFCFNLYS